MTERNQQKNEKPKGWNLELNLKHKIWILENKYWQGIPPILWFLDIDRKILVLHCTWHVVGPEAMLLVLTTPFSSYFSHLQYMCKELKLFYWF